MTLLYSVLASLSSICRSTVSFWSLSRCIILSYARIQCVSFIEFKGIASIRFALQWYVIMMYWFPLQVWIGKRPVLSVYNLLMGVTWRNIPFERIWGIWSTGVLVGWGLGLVDLKPWHFCTRCPMMVASADGQYLVALASVSPGQDEYFPAPIDLTM